MRKVCHQEKPKFVSDMFERMATDWAMWEAIGTISASIIALSFGLYTIIKESRKKPKIILEHDPATHILKKNEVDMYYLKIKNIGPTTAEDVNVRLLEARQDDTILSDPKDRYHIFSQGRIQNQDFMMINFIQNHKNQDFFMTPAGQDKKFPRKKTTFTFLITADNFPSYQKTITIEPDQSNKKLKIRL